MPKATSEPEKLTAPMNAAGGYVVTERMLQMFKASGQKKKKEAA